MADAGCREADILRHLCPVDSDISEHPGKQHVLRILDHFEIKGPNGTHQVLVTDVLLPLDSVREMGSKAPINSKKTCYESVLGLSYLTHKGVVHGDLHTSNIAFSMPGLNALTGEKVQSLLWTNCLPVVPRRLEEQSDSFPKYLIDRADFSALVKHLSAKNGACDMLAVITDFGQDDRLNSQYLAFGLSDPVPEPCTAESFPPPEAILQSEKNLKRWDFETRSKGDIWSMGCCIYEIFRGPILFAIRGEDKKKLEHMGKITTELREISDGIETQPQPNSMRIPCDKALAGLLSQMLRMDAAERQAAEILVQNPWFDS
ncbi:hypothetical protein H0H81_005603, partial [Sphagnurus paluster]